MWFSPHIIFIFFYKCVYFVGKGTGKLNIQCSVGSLLSKTYEVQDCLVYDNASSNRSSNYNSVNTSLTYDTDHYVSSASCSSSTSNFFSFINPKASIGLPRNVEVEIDIKQTGDLTGQWGISFTNGQGKTSSTYYTVCGFFNSQTNNVGIIYNAPWGDKRTTKTPSLNVWYHLKIQVNGTTVSLELKQGDTVLFNDSSTVSFMSSLTYLNVHQGQSSGNTVHFKNLKVKAL